MEKHKMKFTYGFKLKKKKKKKYHRITWPLKTRVADPGVRRIRYFLDYRIRIRVILLFLKKRNDGGRIRIFFSKVGSGSDVFLTAGSG